MIIIKDKNSVSKLYFHKLDEYSTLETVTVTINFVGIGEEVYNIGTYVIEDKYDNFYVVEPDLSKIPDGEYEWRLYVCDEGTRDILSLNNMQYNDCGLMRIGDLYRSTIQPDFDKDDVTQFENKNNYKEFNG